MKFTALESGLLVRKGKEILQIEAWGTNALRIRATKNAAFSGLDKALTETVGHEAKVVILPEEKAANDCYAYVENGKICCTVSRVGILTFYLNGKRVLREYYSNYDGSLTRESECFKKISREFKGLASDSYKLTMRFEADKREKIFGMGQYQQSFLDIKGCVLELAQKNSQVSVPFMVSNLGYGLLWNNPGTGEVTFGRNITQWVADETDELDYWITADDTPAAIVKNYTEAVGRAPVMGKEYLGLWQCKLRYRTPEEVLEVFREYKKRGIHLDVIVIDFFHWPVQGDWCFDETYWPKDKVKAMAEEIHAEGTKIMVSVWPSVDKRSSSYAELAEDGLLSLTEKGSQQTYDYQGDCGTIDLFAPEAQEYIWNKCRKNYLDWGMDLFWLDNSEPDQVAYDLDNLRYATGRSTKVGNEYPKKYAEAFAGGLRSAGRDNFVNLVRSAWVGSQKYSTLVWTGDVQSTFEAFRDQVVAGLNIGLAGIPWWTTDIGGFMTHDVNDPYFRELLIRWYEFGVFCPILRMHGDRGPYDIPPLDNRDFGGGYLHTGQPNELWSYGEDNYAIMKKYLDIRLSLKDYVAGLMKEASETGAPVIRTMFFEFPGDEKCWEIEDQYMFGPDYLVAPVLEQGMEEREVYLPAGCWENFHTGEKVEGGRFVTVKTPLDVIPVFKRK